MSLVVAVSCGGGGTGGPNSSDPDVGTQLIVQQVLPTNGQEVEGDLTDAGEEQDAGVITVKFSETLDPSTVLDPNNALNGLTSDVNILDSGFHRVAGTPSITGPRNNILRFRPADGTLDNGQYTVTISRDVKSAFNAPLNQAQWDFRSSFTVGTDVYSPVVRNSFPAQNQKDVSKTSQIIVSFNESLNPATVNSGTFTVVDGGTNPPTVIGGTIDLSHDNFDIIFTPDPQNPLPPNATIVVTVVGNQTGVTDSVGNPFDDDVLTAGYQDFILTFETVSEPPLPNNPRTVYYFPYVPPFDPAIPSNGAVYYGAEGTFGVLEELPYIGSYTDLTTWGTNNPVQHSEWPMEVKGQPGRIGEMVVDRRFNPTDGHSWIYVTDTRNKALHIVGSRDSRIVHTWTQLPDPTGLGIRPNSSSLYVTSKGSDIVSMINIGTAIPVGTRGVTDAVKDLASYQKRSDLKVGRGPVGVAHVGDSQTDPHWLIVCNYEGDSVTCIDSSIFKVDNEINVAARPIDVATTLFYPAPVPPYLIGRFAYVTCAGTGSSGGKVALLWKSHLNVPGLKTPSGHWELQGTMEGVESPREIFFDGLLRAWFADAEADEAVKMWWDYAGSPLPGFFFANPQPFILNRVEVPEYPTGVTMEPWVYFATNFGSPIFSPLATNPQATLVACQAAGQIAVIDNVTPSRPIFTIEKPKVHTLASYYDE